MFLSFPMYCAYRWIILYLLTYMLPLDHYSLLFTPSVIFSLPPYTFLLLFPLFLWILHLFLSDFFSADSSYSKVGTVFISKLFVIFFIQFIFFDVAVMQNFERRENSFSIVVCTILYSRWLMDFSSIIGFFFSDSPKYSISCNLTSFSIFVLSAIALQPEDSLTDLQNWARLHMSRETCHLPWTSMSGTRVKGTAEILHGWASRELPS